MLLDHKTLQRLNEIGIALSKERDIPRLLEKILLSAKELTHADGGTIYTVTSEQTLHFEIVMSDSLELHVGGTSGLPVPFLDLPLFDEGDPNDALMVAYAVNRKRMVVVKDAYYEKGFDFSGTRLFDESTGYRTQAVLTIPIKNHEDEVIAALQLINPVEDGSVTTFTKEDEQLAESLASQAGIALTNQLLITNLRSLLESLVRVVAEAIDEKSPSTGNHGKRVPVIAQLLARAVNTFDEGEYKGVHFSEDELYELDMAAFLHDCGKITTPVHIVEKHTKLETICDRIELIKARFQALNEKTEKECLQQKLLWFETHFPKEFSSGRSDFLLLEKEAFEKQKEYREDLDFIEQCNQGSETVTEEMLERLKQIGHINYDTTLPLLNPDELKNLSIVKGTLTDEERQIIQHHVVMTYRMLSQLVYPKELKQVTEIAASHHERVDGKGYPRGLKKEQMSVQARILAIADIFEALSAPDRPYKKPFPLSRVFKIMQEMVDEGHLDPGLFEIFIRQKAYLPYARQYLTSEQLDFND